MYSPSRKEFVKKARGGNLIPVYGELLSDFETPVSAFSKIDRGGFSYLLESVEGGEKLARYSFLGSTPSVLFQSKGRNITITEGKIRFEISTNRTRSSGSPQAWILTGRHSRCFFKNGQPI